MEAYFSADFFIGNRRKLRELFTGKAPIVLTANGMVQRSGDSSFPFRQDSNFWYLTGIDEPDIVLVLDKNKEYLIVPKREQHRDAFEGKIDHEVLSRQSGIADILDNKEGWRRLSARLKKVKHIATLASAPAYIDHYGLYTNPARAILIEKIKKINPNVELLDLRQHLSRMRMVKQPEELKALQAAITITVGTIKKIKTKLPKYTHEYKLEADITREFRRQGTGGHAYEPIIAGGGNACTLHYAANNSALSPKELVLIDVGAAVSHYAADITRTFALQEPTKRQKNIHTAVLEVHRFALAQLKPGLELKKYEQKVEQFMGEKLRELGLITTINHENVRQFCPHATSHFLGLDVHDAGDYSRPLEPGMVLTVEPGIYIPKEKIGIRIEDDVLITPSGIEVLSDKLPRQLW